VLGKGWAKLRVLDHMFNNNQYQQNTSKAPAKTEIVSLAKLVQNYNENRDYLKCHSVKRVQNKCKLFEGLRGTL